jgi:hypothetical protein
MKTAAFCLRSNSSSADTRSSIEGVDMNLSAGKIQLNLALGNAGPDVVIVVFVVVLVAVDDACKICVDI